MSQRARRIRIIIAWVLRGDALDVEWIDVQQMGDPTPTYIPGQVECPNRCDPRIPTRDDGPIYNATGECVSLGLAAEIKQITGDRDATLRSVIEDPDVERRVETLRRIQLAAARLPVGD